MSSIYEEHKDEDGFLYITYVGPMAHSMWPYADVTADTPARTRSVQAPRYRALDHAAVTLSDDGGLGRLGNWSDLVNE